MPKGKTRAERRHAAVMSRGAAQPVRLTSLEQRSTGELRVERWERPARLKRAAKRLASLWGLAVLAILIPVVHFILVPALLVAGVVGGMARLRQLSGILGGEGPCPACGLALNIAARPDEWPLFERCQGCGALVTIERLEEATGAASPRSPRASRLPG